ncbi:MAG: MFS transporter [Pseudomonadota bacterium]
MNSETTRNTDAGITRSEFQFIARLSIVSVSRMFGLFMVLPVLAIWANDLVGATPVLVGIAVGGYGVTQALLQIPYGALSDRIGRAPVVIGGLTIFVIGSLLAASATGIWGVIAGRLLQGAGAVSATLSAWLADGTRSTIRTSAMAIFGASIGASFLLALVFGSLLSEAVGVRGLFWLSAGLGLLGIALASPDLWRPSTPLPQRTPDVSAERNWRRILRRELLVLDIGVLLLHAALTAFFVLVPFALSARIGLASTEHWKLYSATLLLSLPLCVPLIARDGRRRGAAFVPAALAMLAGGFALLAFSGASLSAFAVGCTLFFAGFSYLEAALPAEISRRADPDQRGASLGVFAGSQFFGAFVGGVGGGWLLTVGGADVGLLFMTGILGVWFILGGVIGTRGDKTVHTGA